MIDVIIIFRGDSVEAWEGAPPWRMPDFGFDRHHHHHLRHRHHHHLHHHHHLYHHNHHHHHNHLHHHNHHHHHHNHYHHLFSGMHQRKQNMEVYRFLKSQVGILANKYLKKNFCLNIAMKKVLKFLETLKIV